MTLLVLGLLTASALSLMRLADLEFRVADNTYAFAQAEILAQAGLQGAMTLLAMDDNDYDAPTDPWGRFGQYASLATGFIEEGAFGGRIEDLSGLIDINSLVDRTGVPVTQRIEQFDRLLRLLELDPDILPDLLDWLDPDDEARMGGAETPYYRQLDPPYPCGNGPLDTEAQLGLVKGFGRRVLDGQDDRPGLRPYVTVHSSGLININTAPEPVLLSLDDGLTRAVVQEIMGRRASQPFEKLDELRDLPGLTPELLNRIVPLISVKSEFFRIRVEGSFRQARAAVTAVVYRSQSGVRLIYYLQG